MNEKNTGKSTYPKLISISEYAALHGKAAISVQQKARRGGFKTARKIGRNWVIESDEPYTDRRRKEAGRIKTAENLYELTSQEMGGYKKKSGC